MHLDITKMLENFGVKVTTVQYGDQKSDTYPTTPLSDEARARMQADVDVMGEMFVNLVARGRGIDASVVRETEAGCFLGAAAVRVGFADAVMSVEEAFLEIINLAADPAKGFRSQRKSQAKRRNKNMTRASDDQDQDEQDPKKKKPKKPVDDGNGDEGDNDDSPETKKAKADEIVRMGQIRRGEIPDDRPTPTIDRAAQTVVKNPEGLAAQIVAAGRKAKGQQ